ncbi:MAG: hypothetical protein V3W00_04180 [Candidatus Brocadiales bacterium]
MSFGVILGGLLCIMALLVVFYSLRRGKPKPTSSTATRTPAKRSLKCCGLNKSELNVFGRR